MDSFQTAYAHHPDLTVEVRTADEVATAVRHAAERDLPIGVHATGHGLSVPLDGGVLIGTARLDGLRIDPETRIARVEAGVRAGALLEAAAEHGLAPLSGSSPSVSVVGYLLGSGLGLLARNYGYAADRVRASSWSPPTASGAGSSRATRCSARYSAPSATSVSSPPSSWSCSRWPRSTAASWSSTPDSPSRCSTPGAPGPRPRRRP
ncbi:FAD-binding oxidoreductase [Nocardia asteroides]|uniref:FAD-binding oxidoreductase n=1 Tax=Nocardia asteroides TaxID=1824 RepID=UPI001E59A1E1|nr:FAD-binding protein [Nocardia asteroides]UGT60820.1 FAD-dependent oxidoreductase [Nocardia asteroides]